MIRRQVNHRCNINEQHEDSFLHKVDVLSSIPLTVQRIARRHGQREHLVDDFQDEGRILVPEE